MKAQPRPSIQYSRSSLFLCMTALAACLLTTPAVKADDFATLVFPSAATDVRVAEGEVIEIVTLHFDSGWGDQAPSPNDKIPCMRVVRGYASAVFDVPVMIKHQATGGRFLVAGPAIVSFVDVAKPATLLVTYRAFSCKGGGGGGGPEHAH